MKRGGIRTTKLYVVEDKIKKTKYQVQGKKNGIWIPVVEKSNLGNVPLNFETKEEADKKLLEIYGSIRQRQSTMSFKQPKRTGKKK